eukprot:jgi/Mesvir1/4258/Mv22222-RA.1
MKPPNKASSKSRKGGRSTAKDPAGLLTGKALTSYTIGGRTFKVNECVTMLPPDKRLPYIAKIEKFVAHPDPAEGMQVLVHWFYRPEESLGGRKGFHGERELFLSDHVDWVAAASINGVCDVHSLKDYTRLTQVKQTDYFCRFTYKATTGKVKPDRVPVYCTCDMPYNPDHFMIECDTCKEWYHPQCIGLQVEEIKTKGKWQCHDCVSLPPGAADAAASNANGNRQPGSVSWPLPCVECVPVGVGAWECVPVGVGAWECVPVGVGAWECVPVGVGAWECVWNGNGACPGTLACPWLWCAAGTFLAPRALGQDFPPAVLFRTQVPCTTRPLPFAPRHLHLHSSVGGVAEWPTCPLLAAACCGPMRWVLHPKDLSGWWCTHVYMLL